MRGRKIIIAGVVIAGCAALALYSMRGALSPYVSFREAMAARTPVQIIGSLDRAVPVRHFEGGYTFTLTEKGGVSMPVEHRGAKPLNFEHTSQVVAIGTYDSARAVFRADKILVKCPSKYRPQQPK